MLHSKTFAFGLVIVAVLTMVGTGYAAFSTSGYLRGSASAGTIGPLTWGAGPTSTGYGSNDVCNAVVGTTNVAGDTLFITADKLLPGDYCTFGDTLTLSGGSLPANTTAVVTSSSGGLCAVLHYGDSFFSHSIVLGSGGQVGNVWHVIQPGHSMNWAGTISLPGNTGNAYQGLGCSFVVTLTGAAGT
jgi:hypothetical protein